MTQKEIADRLTEIEAMMHDLDHRLLWIESQLGVPMLIVDHAIAATVDDRRRDRFCGVASLPSGHDDD